MRPPPPPIQWDEQPLLPASLWAAVVDVLRLIFGIQRRS